MTRYIIILTALVLSLAGPAAAENRKPRFVVEMLIEHENTLHAKHGVKVAEFPTPTEARVLWEPEQPCWLGGSCLFGNQALLIVGLADFQYGPIENLIIKELDEEGLEWEYNIPASPRLNVAGGIVDSDNGRYLMMSTKLDSRFTQAYSIVNLQTGSLATAESIGPYIRDLRAGGIDMESIYHISTTLFLVRNRESPCSLLVDTGGPFAQFPDSLCDELDLRWALIANDSEKAVFIGMNTWVLDSTSDVMVYRYGSETWESAILPGSFTRLTSYGQLCAGNRIEMSLESKYMGDPQPGHRGTEIIVFDPMTMAVTTIEMGALVHLLWIEPGRVIYQHSGKVWDAAYEGGEIISRSVMVDHEISKSGMLRIYWVDDDEPPTVSSDSSDCGFEIEVEIDP